MRYFKYIIILFFVFGLGFVLLKEEKTPTVVSFKHNINQLINEEEVIRIPLLANVDNLPLTDKEMILKTSLFNENYEIPCKLDEIKKEAYTINYVDDIYYSYMVDLILENKNPLYNLDEASLRLELIDGSIYEFEVGSVNLNHGNLESFYVTNLASRSDNLGDFYTVKEVVIGLEATSSLLLEEITLANSKVKIDNSKIKVFNTLKEVSDYQDKTSLDNLVYENISDKKLNLRFKKNEKKYLVIPLTYLEKTYLPRFYLEFKVNGKSEFLDDNIYLNQGFYPSFIFKDSVSYELS